MGMMIEHLAEVQRTLQPFISRRFFIWKNWFLLFLL